MSKSWLSFEARVRGLATYLYGRPCLPKNVGGVDVDGVIELDDETIILIEITERCDLAKVREDVGKLQTARSALWAGSGIQARCWCVIDGPVTSSMAEAGNRNCSPG